MCCEVDEVLKEKYANRKYMWKVYAVRHGKLVSAWINHEVDVGSTQIAMPRDRVTRDRIRNAVGFTDISEGVFHGFVSKDDANKNCVTEGDEIVCRVEILEYATAGYFGLNHTICAFKIRLPNRITYTDLKGKRHEIRTNRRRAGVSGA